MVASIAPTTPFLNFEMGESYAHREIWKGAGPGFGTFSAGINPKGTWPNTEAVVVLAEIGNGPYADHWENGDLLYSGEDDAPKFGVDAYRYDQDLEKGRNRVLTYQQRKRIPTYLFWRITGDAAYRYAGLVEVVDVALVPVTLAHGGTRLEAKYRLRSLQIGTSTQLAAIEHELAETFSNVEPPPPQLTTPATAEKKRFQTARDRVFARKVKEAYGWACAVCGACRLNALGQAEVEAAHLYPRDLHGADDPRNGLALCRFHHWALDGYLFVLDDDLRIQCCNGGETVGDLGQYHGTKLKIVPPLPAHRPHPLFLEARRKIAEKIPKHASKDARTPRTGKRLSPERQRAA
jgi:putative restriction endonuclease